MRLKSKMKTTTDFLCYSIRNYEIEKLTSFNLYGTLDFKVYQFKSVV